MKSSKRLSEEKALDVKPSTPDDARASVRKGSAIVAVIIPPNFGQDAGRAFFGPEQKPEIGLLFDPSHSAERAMVSGMLAGDVMQAVSKEMFTGQSGRADGEGFARQVEQSQDLPPEDKKHWKICCAAWTAGTSSPIRARAPASPRAD